MKGARAEHRQDSNQTFKRGGETPPYRQHIYKGIRKRIDRAGAAVCPMKDRFQD
jgi:hypothetical protein